MTRCVNRDTGPTESPVRYTSRTANPRCSKGRKCRAFNVTIVVARSSNAHSAISASYVCPPAILASAQARNHRHV